MISDNAPVDIAEIFAKAIADCPRLHGGDGSYVEEG